jgi:hypothetical protein
MLKTIYTETTVEDLLTYIETKIAEHDPDASECDCHICSVHNTIVWWTMLRSKVA